MLITVKLLQSNFMLKVILTIYLHLSHPEAAALKTQNSDVASRGIMDRLSFGKVWFAYIEAYFSDILHRTFLYRTGSSDVSFMRLLDAVTQMNMLKIPSYPCQSLNISFDRNTIHGDVVKKGLSQQQFEWYTRSKLCGNISSSYGLVAPSSGSSLHHSYKDLTWLWKIRVNQHFIINVTFLSLRATFYPSCFTTRILIREGHDVNRSDSGILGQFCPGNPPESFFPPAML